jgi:hypothetical protein
MIYFGVGWHDREFFEKRKKGETKGSDPLNPPHLSHSPLQDTGQSRCPSEDIRSSSPGTTLLYSPTQRKASADEGQAAPASPCCDGARLQLGVSLLVVRLTGPEERRHGTWISNQLAYGALAKASVPSPSIRGSFKG